MFKKLYLFLTLLTAFLWLGSGTMWGETITVANSTDYNTKYAPVYGYNCDNYVRCQIIYSSDDTYALGTTVNGNQITKITYYLKTASDKAWKNNFQVKMKEIEASSFANTSFLSVSDATLVYEGTLNATGSTMEITLDNAYDYHGGNLLVDISATTAGGSGNYTSSSKGYFYAENVTASANTVLYGNSTAASISIGTLMGNRPKTTFTYEAPASGPALRVYDGATKLTSDDSYNFGLATEGTTKTFTLKNPGTEATPVSVAHTGSFDAVLSAATIPTGEEITLTVTMPAASGSDAITISSTAEGVEDFVINVRGTIKDPTRIFETLLDGSRPTGWTSSGTWYWTATSVYNSAYYSTNNYRLITPLLTVAEGETFYFDAQGRYAGYQGVILEYSADGTSWTASSTTTTLTSDWQTFMINDIPAGKYYIALHGWSVNIRNYYGGYIPATPKDIILTGRTTESLTLNWTPAGSETSWVLQYSTDNSTWSSNVAVSSKPFELTGLNPSTKYYIRVRNAATSDWSESADFRTECGAITSSTWTESFDGAANEEVPPCWSVIVTDATYPKIYASTSSSHYHTASPGLLINNKHLKYGLAVFPEIANLNTLQVSFWHKEEGGTSNCGSLELGYLTNAADSTTFHLIKACDNANATWAQVTDINLSSVPAGARLAFRYIGKSTSWEYYTAVDDIAFSLAPACPNPTELGYSEKAAHSVKLSWTSTASAWKVEYSMNSDFSASSIKNATTKPYVLDELEANAHYYVRVLTDCGASGESDPSNVIDFTTECDPIAMPLVEDFESGAFEDCWKADSRWAINSNAHEGSYCARYTSGAKGDLVLPSITLSDDAMLFYWHASTYPTGAVLVNGTSVQTISTTTNGDWKKDSLDLSSYKGQTVVITFESNYTSYSNRYLYIDSVAVGYKPVVVPTNLAVEPGNASAAITWDSEEGTSWNLRYRAVGATDWTEENGLATKSKELSSLTNGAEYEVQVQAVCSANRKSNWTASETFIPTACATVETVTFGAKTYNSVVVNWTASAVGTWDIHYKAAGDADWTSAGTGLTEATKTLTGLTTGVAYTIEVKAACGDVWVAAAEAFTPVYSAPSSASVTGATDATASASWDAVADADSYQYIVLASGEPNWDSANPAAENSASLSGLNAGTAYTLYVRSVYSTGYSEAVTANFSTITIAPQNLQQDGESTTNSATFTWEANGAATHYQWSTDNSTWSEPITALTATAEGLNSGSDYTFYVRSYYAENVYSTAISLPFHTQCAEKSLGYSQNFDDASALPACWESTNFGSGNNKWNIGMSWYDYKSSWNSARFYAYKNSGSETADLITPAFELTDPALLKFYYKNESGVTAKVLIRIAGEEDAEIWTASTKGSWAATPESIDLTTYKGKTARFIFRAWGSSTTSSKSFYLDNVSVEAKPCPQLQNLEAVPTPDGAEISWEQGVDENRYQYCVVDEGAAASGWILLDEDEYSVTISGKTFGNTYDCYVRSYCGASSQSEPLMVQFTPSCVAPSALAISAVTDESATLSWTSNAKALRYKAAGEDWTNKTIDPIATSYAFTGLNGSTTYTVQVQSFCAANESEFWSDEFEFATKCAARNADELPLNEDFTAGVPECWESGTEIALSVAGEKLNFMGEDEQIAILPKYNINLNKLSVLMDYSTGANIELGYYTSLTAAYQTLGDISDDVELDLASIAPASVGYLAIRYYNGNGMTQANINSIRVRKTPSCLAPTGVDATPGVGSASISWTENGSAEAWNLQYKLASAADWTTVAVTENPYALSGLEYGVSYKVRVQAACAGEDPSDWSDEASFTTDCDVIAALPWYADFSQDLSNCWTIYAQDETYYKPAANTIQQDLQISGGKDGASNNVVVLPAISASLTNAVLSFEYRGSEGSQYAQLEAGYMTDKDDATTFTALETLAQAGSYTEARVALATVPAGKYLAFRYAGASSHGDQYIKNLRVINAYNFADNDDNSETLASLNGQTVDVTIGRTFVCADYFNTICLPFSLSAEELAASPIASNDLWAFKYARVEGGELLIRIVEAESINAGEPYLISWPEGDAIENPLFKNVKISASAGKTMGEENLKFVGTLKPETFAPHDDSKLFLYQNNTLYWWDGDATRTMKSFRAFFTVEGGAGSSTIKHMPARIIKQEETTTGIDNSNVENITIKRLENNQVVIIRNGVKYNIQGQVIQ